jgi:hypothetical protein
MNFKIVSELLEHPVYSHIEKRDKWTPFYVGVICCYFFYFKQIFITKISSSTSVSLLILLIFIYRFSIRYDIIIYTATPSGIATVITAAHTLPSLSVIIEPTPYVGRISLRDLELEDVREFFLGIFDISLNALFARP